MAMKLRGVLVGVGDEYEAMPELDWGAREALARGGPLRLVRAYHRSQYGRPWPTETCPPGPAEMRADALHRLQRAMAHVHANWPDLEVCVDAEDGPPAQVLVDASASADVTVLGSRHFGPLGGLLLGSVSSRVAAHARGPLVVVRSAARVPVVQPAVVVGLYGSEGAERLLRFSFDHAARHHRALEAVVCVAEPDELRLTGRAPTALTERAGRWLAETLAPWHARYPDLELRETVIVTRPVIGLVETSVGQELLVVGRRTPETWAALGSVTQGVLHHAECPVAVVPLDADVKGSAASEGSVRRSRSST